jgi:hypothetical protein
MNKTFITVGQIQWILFWAAIFCTPGEPGLWVVWVGSLLAL